MGYESEEVNKYSIRKGAYTLTNIEDDKYRRRKTRRGKQTNKQTNEISLKQLCVYTDKYPLVYLRRHKD